MTRDENFKHELLSNADRFDSYAHIVRTYPDYFPEGDPRRTAKRYSDSIGLTINKPRPGHRTIGRTSPIPSTTSGGAAGCARHDDTTDVKSGTRTVTAQSRDKRLQSIETFAALYDIDLAEWEATKFSTRAWEVTTKDAENNPVVTPMFGSNADFRRRVALVSTRSEIDAMLLEARAGMPIFAPTILRRERTREGVLLIPAIADLHIGKLAHIEESGDNFDSKIAEGVFALAIDDALQKARGYDVARILFPVGNDLLTADNARGETTGQTRQDVDSRFHKSFRLARRLMTGAIERLREIAPVDVVIVPGNHDTMSAFAIGDALDCYFHAADNVSIDNRACLRKCYAWEQNMIGLTHGDKEKHADLPLLFASEFPHEWAKASGGERTVMVGHLHTQALKEFHGCTVRYLPSLSGTDAWHNSMGYVGNRKMSQAFVFSAENGCVAQYNFTAPHDVYKGGATPSRQ